MASVAAACSVVVVAAEVGGLVDELPKRRSRILLRALERVLVMTVHRTRKDDAEDNTGEANCRTNRCMIHGRKECDDR